MGQPFVAMRYVRLPFETSHMLPLTVGYLSPA